MKILNLITTIGLFIDLSYAFYVPGIAPKEFKVNDLIGKYAVLMMLAQKIDDEKSFAGCLIFV